MAGGSQEPPTASMGVDRLGLLSWRGEVPAVFRGEWLPQAILHLSTAALSRHQAVLRIHNTLKPKGLWLPEEKIEHTLHKLEDNLLEQHRELQVTLRSARRQEQDLERNGFRQMGNMLKRRVEALEADLARLEEKRAELPILQEPLREASSYWHKVSSEMHRQSYLFHDWRDIVRHHSRGLLDGFVQIGLGVELGGSQESVQLRETLRVLETSPDKSALPLLIQLASAHQLPSAVVPSLCRLLEKTKAPEVRYRTIELLGKVTAPTAFEPLREALFDQRDKQLRWLAAEALGERNSPDSFESLADALLDEEAQVRWRAVEALGRFEDKRLVRLMVRMTSDESPLVRRAAVTQLSSFSNPRVRQALERCRRDPDSEVRRICAEALRQMMGRR